MIKKIKYFINLIFKCNHEYITTAFNPYYIKYYCIKCKKTKEYRRTNCLEEFKIKQN